MTTRRERLEARRDRREEWATKASKRSNDAYASTTRIADGIPMGQPILVGHHSERRHRRDVQRIHDGMTRSCNEAALAKRHANAADGIDRMLEHSIFSDDADAIVKIQEKIAKLEAERDAIKALNARCRKGDEAAIAEVNRLHPRLAQCGHDPRRGIPAYATRNLGAEIRRLKQRIDEIKQRNERTSKAEERGGMVIERRGEWCSVVFAEKPERAVLAALREANFHWGQGRWSGRTAMLPRVVLDMETPMPDTEEHIDIIDLDDVTAPIDPPSDEPTSPEAKFRRQIVAALRVDDVAVELVDVVTDAVEWSGPMSAWLDAQDPDVLADWELDAWRRIRDLCHHPILVYFGGGAAPLMVLRRPRMPT